MIEIALLLAAKAIEPPRQTDLWVTSQQSLIDLQTCITREWVRYGRVTPIPMQDGTMLDFQFSTFSLTGPGKPTLTLEIHEAGNERRMTVAYRHPWSLKGTYGLFRDTGKRCFPDEWETAALPVPN